MQLVQQLLSFLLEQFLFRGRWFQSDQLIALCQQIRPRYSALSLYVILDSLKFLLSHMNELASVVSDPRQFRLLLELLDTFDALHSTHVELCSHIFDHHNFPSLDEPNELLDSLLGLLSDTFCLHSDEILPIIELILLLFFLVLLQLQFSFFLRLLSCFSLQLSLIQFLFLFFLCFSLLLTILF